MEKRTPHYPLNNVKSLVRKGDVRATRTASRSAAAIGFAFPQMLDSVLNLKPSDFYKSMTTYADHRIWQDVYRFSSTEGRLYIKLSIVRGVLIVSFKEL
jgi:motility quorum-sensing regulator / GCU-specific mRNA interferase toxin